MFNERTDLALELHEINAEKGIDDGIIVDESKEGEILISKIEIINKNGEMLAGKKEGVYVTIDVGEIWNRESQYFRQCVDVISSQIGSLIKAVHNNFLVVGLGNKKILCDAIGPNTVERLLITRHIKTLNYELYNSMAFSNVSSIIPGVLADTGIESREIINAVVSMVEPDVVIVIDSLASRNINRLATTIQISNVGISPGAGVNNRRQELSFDTLGTPVISIGVPTVVDASTLVYNVLGHDVVPNEKNEIIERYFSSKNNFFVSLKESDVIIEKMSILLARSINCALQSNMTLEDLEDLSN